MKVLLLIVSMVLLNGCSTYSQNINAGLSLAHEGNWAAAEPVISDALSSPQDKLLNLLESGALAQYQGDYTRSNALLEQAELLSDTFFSQSFTDRSWALLSNPSQGSYQGNGLERVYISYFKSLNYLALAGRASSRTERQSLMDSALVESRRIDLKLNEIAAQTPSYADLDDKNKAFYEKALNFLAGFYTGSQDADQFSYRDDAWGRYLEGLQYEASKEYDDARIAYQDAANLYEAGYTKQYDLPSQATERAWLDTIRMMKKSGGWDSEYPLLIEQKLSAAAQITLAQYDNLDAELVVLEHQGFIPAKQEMSVLLYGDPYSHSLVLEPLHGGGNTQENDAFHWFTMVYADINPLNMLANYKAGKGWATFEGLFTKRVILGAGIWQQLESLNLDDMLLQQPIRVTIPYYNRFTLDQGTTQLTIRAAQIDAEQDVPSLQEATLTTAADLDADTTSSKPIVNEPAELVATNIADANTAINADTNSDTDTHSPLNRASSGHIRMSSLADIAMQDQLSKAQRDIYESLVREMLRTWLAYQLESAVKDETASLLIGLIGKVAVFASSAAETRNWLTLPAQIRLTRIPLATGHHSAKYQAKNKTFSLADIQLEKNTLKVWNIRNPQ